MKIRNKSNQASSLSPKLRRLAFAQDNQGLLDLTIGKEYQVYGLQKNSRGVFYLILTDSIHNKLPWWMPSDLFEVTDSAIPQTWITKKWGLWKTNEITAPAVYHGHEDDIEDGTGDAKRVFDQMKNEV